MGLQSRWWWQKILDTQMGSLWFNLSLCSITPFCSIMYSKVTTTKICATTPIRMARVEQTRDRSFLEHSCTALARPPLRGATSSSSALVLTSLLTLVLLPSNYGNNHLLLARWSSQVQVIISVIRPYSYALTRILIIEKMNFPTASSRKRSRPRRSAALCAARPASLTGRDPTGHVVQPHKLAATILISYHTFGELFFHAKD